MDRAEYEVRKMMQESEDFWKPFKEAIKKRKPKYKKS